MNTCLKEETIIHIMEALLSIETMEELIDMEKLMYARAKQIYEENPAGFKRLQRTMQAKIK